jgi:hypothetical protein
VTALHEASLKAAADAATMSAKAKAAFSSSSIFMQASLKAAADIATVVTQAEAAVDKSIQVTSTTSGDIPI